MGWRLKFQETFIMLYYAIQTLVTNWRQNKWKIKQLKIIAVPVMTSEYESTIHCDLRKREKAVRYRNWYNVMKPKSLMEQ